MTATAMRRRDQIQPVAWKICCLSVATSYVFDVVSLFAFPDLFCLSDPLLSCSRFLQAG